MDRDWVGLFFTGWRHQLLTGLERGRPFDGPVVGSEAPLPATGHRPPPALPQEQHCREGAREEQNPIKKSVSAQSDPTDWPFDYRRRVTVECFFCGATFGRSPDVFLLFSIGSCCLLFSSATESIHRCHWWQLSNHGRINATAPTETRFLARPTTRIILFVQRRRGAISSLFCRSYYDAGCCHCCCCCCPLLLSFQWRRRHWDGSPPSMSFHWGRAFDFRDSNRVQ